MTVEARYECHNCQSSFYGSRAVFKLPENAIMTMDDNELRKRLEGPLCPVCDSVDVWVPVQTGPGRPE